MSTVFAIPINIYAKTKTGFEQRFKQSRSLNNINSEKQHIADRNSYGRTKNFCHRRGVEKIV